MSSPRWTAEHIVEGQTLFRVGRDGDQLIAQWPGLCELRSDRDGAQSSFSAEEGADPSIIAKVRGGLAAALVRHLRGETSLHACSFSRDQRALACVGPSGAGKSTLAAWMCARRGHALVADDIVGVRSEGGSLYVEPTEREHWLDASSRALLRLGPPPAGEKSAAPAAAVANAPARLVALVSLSYAGTDAVSLVRVRGHRALGLLLPCLVRFVVDEPAAQLDEISRLEALIERAPLYELVAPRDFDALPQIADALETLR